MNFIDEEYPRIYSPPSTKKPFRQNGLIAQDISTQSPSRNIHIKRTGSVIRKKRRSAQMRDCERQTMIFHTPKNSYAFSSSSKIPVQTSALTGMNDTSPLLSPSEHKLPAETRYIEEEMPRITLDQLGGITVPPPEYQSTYENIKSQHSPRSNSYNVAEDARLDSFNEAVKVETEPISCFCS